MNNNHFSKVKDYITELGYSIDLEDQNDGVMVVSNEESGIKHLVVGVSDPLVILEQFIFDVKNESIGMYKSLLQKNRDIIHGAFVLDDAGTKVLFRDTLQIENLDLNELEASINSLALMLSEYSDDILSFSNH